MVSNGVPPGLGEPVSIDDADVGDLDALVDLWVELAADQKAYDSHLLGEPNRDRIRESFARHIVTGGVHVARADAVVGFVMFGLERGSFEQRTTRGIVRNLFVKPAARRTGIGSDLLASAEAALVDAGADVVALEAMAANEAAIRFYQRHGYHLHRVELEKRVENDTHSKEDT